MKKATKLFSILALLLCVVSCQISNVDGVLQDDGFKVTAVIDNSDATRVSYAVDNEAFTITPTWSVGDKVIGYDDKGVTFTFTVESLDGEKAVLNVDGYTPGDAITLYALYAPGSSTAEFADGKLSVGLNPQDGALNDETKVLMSSVGTVADGNVEFTFKKETAILGLKKFRLPVTAVTTITSMDLVGVPHYGTFSLEDGAWKFEPGTGVGLISLKGEWTTDAEGVCSTPVYFSVAPTTGADIVLNMSTGSEKFANVTRIDALDIEAGYYYHMTKILDEPVAAIGDICFGTLEDAFAVANQSDASLTIRILKNCTLTAAVTLSNTNNPGYTLDLNGKTVTTDGTKRINVEGASLHLTDSSTPNVAEQGALTTLESNTGSYILVTKGETGRFTMDGGNILATGYRAINFTEGGSGTLSGGTITAPVAGVAVAIGATGGNVDIEGDIAITGAGNVIYFWGGTGTLSGGYISNAKTSAAVYAAGEAVVTVTGSCHIKTPNLNSAASTGDAVMYVTGGCHSVAVRDVYAVDAESNVYYNVPNPDETTAGDYPYMVVPAASHPLVASVTSGANVWKHADIMSAGTQADIRSKNTAATTLKIEADLNSAQTFSFAEPHKYMLTVDMNGHKLNSTASPALTAECPITIQDSDENGAIITTGDVAVLGLGDVTINGGAYEATMLAVSVADTCALVINDGYFYGGSEDVARGGETATVTISGGWFKNCPNAAYITEGCAANPVSETHLEKTYNYKVAASSVVATVNGTGYASLASAVAAANTNSDAEDAATLVLQEDFENAAKFSLANANKPIVLDLNGHTLSTQDSIFITVSGAVTIKDSGATKGKIIGPWQKVLLVSAGGDVTLSGCTIASTKETGASFSEMAVYVNGSGAKLTINEGTKVYTTRKLTTIRVYTGSLIVNGGEICSGTESEGWYGVVAANTGTVVFNGGSSYTTGTGNASACHIAASGVSITLNDGYFYSNGRCVSTGGSSYGNKLVRNGGYYNSTNGATNLALGEGCSVQELNPAVTRYIETIGQTISYGYQVVK